MTDRALLGHALPLSFVSCVCDHHAFRANLLASACLALGTIHEVIAIANCPSTADGLNAGLKRAKQSGRSAYIRTSTCHPAGTDAWLNNSGRPSPPSADLARSASRRFTGLAR